MAKQDGWTKTPNIILESVSDMTEAELKLTMVLVRLTIGYHRDEVRMTYDDMNQATGLSRPAINRAIDAIENRGFFSRGRRSMWVVNSNKLLLNDGDESNNLLPNDNQNSNNSLLDESNNLLPSQYNKEREEKEKKTTLPEKPKRKKRKTTVLEFEIPETLDTPTFTAAWDDYITHRGEIKGPLTSLAAKKQLNKLEEWGVSRAVAAINHSIANGWKAIYEPKEYKNGSGPQSSRPVPAPASERTPGAY